MSSAAKTYLCTLSCHHVVGYAPLPKLHELLFCRRCNTWRKCLQIERSWHWKCDTRNCPGGFNYGTDVHRARRMGIRHLRLNPGHKVWLYRAETPIELIGDSQPTLPIVIKS